MINSLRDKQIVWKYFIYQ